MNTVIALPPPTTGSVSRLPLVAAAVTMILWASSFIAIRAIAVDYSPGAMALGRLVVGAVALSVVAAVRHSSGRLRIPRGRPLLLVVIYGVLWFGIYAVALNAAEQHLDAGTAALLVNVAPIIVAVLAGLFLAEGFPRSLVAGLIIAFAGVITITVATSAGTMDTIGVVLGLAAAVLYAVGVLVQKKALATVDAFSATWLGCLFGVVACLPFAPTLIREIGTAPTSATAGIVYLGLFPTAIAFSTWAYALSHTSAGKLSASSYLVPGLAVVMSWLILAEIPAPLALAGGALCLVGVAVTRLPTRRR